MKAGNFTESEIATKHGVFNFRVYADAAGKETIVLYSKLLNKENPVLVRIHSECMTGDTFDSLQCDCGEQLSISLEMINNDGNGAIIYLRQEGRGIGLFEKIKSYQLQRSGMDTFEANLALGHKPDERTYEMAQIALQDLGVKQIRLLTNNPSKISEISKLGIHVTERVPLIIAPNRFNQNYFKAKQSKFKHLFNEDVSYYFYQFHADTPEQIVAIGEYVKDIKLDPLLKICVGVTADHYSLSKESSISQIQKLFESCQAYKDFVPILHFSFRHSADPSGDLLEIKRVLPFAQYIQTNDIPIPDLKLIELACTTFLADIPLCDDNFELVHNAVFRKIISDNKAFLLLDNSKGRGVRETKQALQVKIDTLLQYGLNDIAIFGGFGPDELDTYFELRRFYNINFSIDAETKLKTNGQIDIEKTKIYLAQLIRFNNPKTVGVEQTRAFLQDSKLTNLTKTKIENVEFIIQPKVFNSSTFASTAWFTLAVKKQVQGQQTFCEVGCGAGITSCLLALANPKLKVTCTDINPFAVTNAKLNIENLGLSNRIKVHTGDVLDGILKDEKYDTIYWSLPFGFLDPGTTVTLDEMQVFDPGYKAIRKLFATAKNYLKPIGHLLLGFSPDLGDQQLLKALAEDYGVKLETLESTKIKEEQVLEFTLLRGTYEETKTA